MSIDNLRKYRIDIETPPFYNETSKGIALFDLSTAFIGAFLLDLLFNTSNIIPICKNKRLIYYLLVIPIGIVIHHLFAHFNALLNKKEFIFPEEITFLNKKLFTLNFNIYHILITGLIFITIKSCKI